MSDSNGYKMLQDALTALIQSQAILNQNQATFNQTQAALGARLAELEKNIIETNRNNSERFDRIEAILIDHSRILHALPEAIREKIGFKAP